MLVDAVLIFCRNLLLVIALTSIAGSCCGAAFKHREGAAGAAVRMLAVIVVPATLLAFVGLFYWPLALVVSFVIAWWQGRGTGVQLRAQLLAVWSATSLVAKVATLAMIVAISMRAGAAFSMPPTDGDSLLYHLPMTAALLQDHTMWFTRALVYPGAAEIGDAVTAATTGNVNGTALFEFLQLLALVLVAYSWARKAGASSDGAVATSVIAGTLPLVVDHMFTAQNDIFMCATVAASCALWRPSPRWAALSLGMAFAAKLSAIIVVPAVVVVMIAFEGWPFSPTDLACMLAVALPWYFRTWFLTGSPLYTLSSLGWSSSLAANFDASWRLILAALRIYGGIAAIVGVIAVIAAPMTRRRTQFARALPWLAFASFISWIVLPNSAESVTGTLDQIQNGWSLRYGLLLPFTLVVAVPVVLDRMPQVQLAGFVALVAAASAVVRSANLTAGEGSFGFSYAVPLVVATVAMLWALSFFSDRRRVAAATIACVGASLLITATMTAGEQTMRSLWDASYLQWSRFLPPTYIGANERVRKSSKIAVIGMRSFPFVGADFERRTYENIVVEAPQAWLARLRKNGVSLLVASGPTGSPDEPAFLQPLPTERALAASPGVCRIASSGYARLYSLTMLECRTTSTLRPDKWLQTALRARHLK